MMALLLSKSSTDNIATRLWNDWRRAATIHTDFIQSFEMTMKLVAPERLGSFGGSIRQDYDQIWDSTAVEAAQSLVDTLVAGIMPPWSPWFMLVPGEVVTGDDRKVIGDLLAAVNRTLLIELNVTNIVKEAQAAFLDLMCGSADLMVKPRKDGRGVAFKCQPIEQIKVLRESDGSVTHIFREFEYSAAELLRFFRDKLPQIAIAELEEDITRIYRVVEATVLDAGSPIEDPQWMRFLLTDLSGSASGVASVTDIGPLILEQEDLDFNPHHVINWAPVPNSPYGRGPATMAYGDIRSLNKTKELLLKNMWKQVAGVYTYKPDGIFNPKTMRPRPGAFIPVGSTSTQEPTIAPLPFSSDIGAAQIGIADLRESIRAMFLSGSFSPVQGTKMSATEIVTRSRELADRLGATYAGIVNDLLIPIIEKTIRILAKQKRIPEQIKLDRSVVDVVFLAQLAQAQRLQEVDSMLQFAQFAQLLTQGDPSQAILDPVKFQRRIAELLAVDSRLLKSDAELEQQAQRLAQAQAQTQQAAPVAAPGGIQ
ncbi:MAG: hypothetical protein D6816_16995 [Bacteroidetes bacterium]|nr:MAG: hypothetical protein D6816_16995 [Bacteroidota bacterium]